MNCKERTVIVTDLLWGLWRRWPAMKGLVVFVALALLALGWAMNRGGWRRPAGREGPPYFDYPFDWAQGMAQYKAEPMNISAPTSPETENDGGVADDLPSDRLGPRLGEMPIPAALEQDGGFADDLSSDRLGSGVNETPIPAALGTKTEVSSTLVIGKSAGQTPIPAVLGRDGGLAGDLLLGRVDPGVTKTPIPSTSGTRTEVSTLAVSKGAGQTPIPAALGQDGGLPSDLSLDRLLDPGVGETSISLTLGFGTEVSALAIGKGAGQTPIPTALGQNGGFADDLSLDRLDPGLGQTPTPAALGRGGFLPALTAAPTDTTPQSRQEVITYTVQEGDTVWDIAQRFGISSDTIIWANNWLEVDRDFLSIGQELIIPPVSGVLHTVRAGDTLESIAKRYGVSIQVIVAYEANHLQEPYILIPGQQIIVPGGRKPFVPRLVYTEKGPITVNAQPEAGWFIGPASGYLTQYFSRQHPAIDLANAEGTPVRAADAGQVTFAGWAGMLGNAVFIDHSNSYVSRYAHLKSYAVEAGQPVERGQVIGEMGNTGNSTGPHLHFAIRYLGGAVNPIRYLPPIGPLER